MAVEMRRSSIECEGDGKALAKLGSKEQAWPAKL